MCLLIPAEVMEIEAFRRGMAFGVWQGRGWKDRDTPRPPPVEYARHKFLPFRGRVGSRIACFNAVCPAGLPHLIALSTGNYLIVFGINGRAGAGWRVQ